MFDAEVGGSMSSPETTDTSPESDFSEAIDLFFGNWIWRAIHALIEHPGFKSSPQWIADTLSISVEEAVDAVGGLEDLGLIFRDEKGAIKLKVQQFLLPPDKKTRSYAIHKHKQLSQQILAGTTAENSVSTFSFFLNVSTEDLLHIIRKFKEEICQLDSRKSLSDENDHSTVHALTLTCNNITSLLDQRRSK